MFRVASTKLERATKRVRTPRRRRFSRKPFPPGYPLELSHRGAIQSSPMVGGNLFADAGQLAQLQYSHDVRRQELPNTQGCDVLRFDFPNRVVYRGASVQEAANGFVSHYEKNHPASRAHVEMTAMISTSYAPGVARWFLFPATLRYLCGRGPAVFAIDAAWFNPEKELVRQEYSRSIVTESNSSWEREVSIGSCVYEHAIMATMPYGPLKVRQGLPQAQELYISPETCTAEFLRLASNEIMPSMYAVLRQNYNPKTRRVEFTQGSFDRYLSCQVALYQEFNASQRFDAIEVVDADGQSVAAPTYNIDGVVAHAVDVANRCRRAESASRLTVGSSTLFSNRQLPACNAPTVKVATDDDTQQPPKPHNM